ncbi:unnamed protein product [Rhizoctonia solani]|uniref:Mid2 domain-containing protein n=1 Tax=Rhizoctonia solani TaxID=456999 RepID=A0A8H3DQF7_9AGAM|nr:unnamed protein product [Rhizoctonia solani]
MHAISVLLVAIAYFSPTVVGWAFLVRSKTISEGASATFEITDDGGGFTFPYTMTVLKRVPNSNDEQVGLVLTSGNETTFYWTCNQPAGAYVRFRLMSAAQVNAATSDYYEIQASTYQPSAQATASSLSALSVQSTSSLYMKTQTTQGSGIATAPSTTASSSPSPASSGQTPVGAIVGAAIGGVLFLAVLGIIAFWIRRRKRSSVDTQGMVQHDYDPYVTPFTHGQTTQAIPPAGYVSQSNFEEEPPVYSPHNTEATTYFTGSESGRTQSSYRSAPPTGKSRYLPVNTQAN